MATGPKIVHKQFNSPIGLYSQRNIQETLNKHLSNLDNGGVGIDFSNPSTDKPGNLAHSAVLRMLEEEERGRRNPGQKKVVWPPVPETNGYHQPQHQQQAYPQQQPQYSPQQYSQPQQQQPQHYQQQQYSQPEYPPQYSPPEYPPQYDYQPPQRQFEPPPATITLRQQPPVHQKPPPVFASQPATASYQGGVNMRGDQKWPPQSVREAVAAENEARLQLAKGPACRPRKVKKDYTGFFAQHALNQSYPGYRAPPGTQHYEDHSGRSSY
ncbi:AT-rich interactive domain-containing protein 1A-like isoform X7 [Leguminivora glycinivorella]|uniref:AT-rich interactive domain-containing protein 1A-like isoform X7 n=1 Tax=Leguminivora glycinivorella TaxID=1035111 RepID=UPI00200FE82B|nr:AT-rich interactive domain-containing protein 1A-like isoform X7 [Leguminivora glycinivorella]